MVSDVHFSGFFWLLEDSRSVHPVIGGSCHDGSVGPVPPPSLLAGSILETGTPLGAWLGLSTSVSVTGRLSDFQNGASGGGTAAFSPPAFPKRLPPSGRVL